MIDLQQATQASINDFGRTLLSHYQHDLPSFEAAAQVCVETIYNTFTTADNSPAFVLVRVYRLTTFNEMSEELRALVQPARERWMTLMGTYGLESAWQDRHESQGHKALNLGEDQSPMVSAAIYQLGLDLGVAMPPGKIDLPITEASFMTRYFHISNALGSPYIPAQEQFVKPYGVKSVIGLGSVFVSKSAYVLLGFARVSISEQLAKTFAQMSPFIATLLASYDARKVWSD